MPSLKVELELTTHDLEFQILGIFHLPCTCILLGKMVKL